MIKYILIRNLKIYFHVLSEIISSKFLGQSDIGQPITLLGRVWHKEIHSASNSILIYILESKDIKICIFNLENSHVQGITREAFIKISGTVKKSPFKFLNQYIIEGNTLELISNNIEMNEVVYNRLSSIRFLYIRKPEIKFILLIKRKIRKYITDYLEDQGYLFFETPILSSFPQVNRKAFRVTNSQKNTNSDQFLIQKSQFYLDAFAHSFGKVYTTTPAFRADHRESDFLLAEFWLIEVEELFSSQKEQMNLVENTLKFVSSQLISQDKSLINNLIKYRMIDEIYNKDMCISDFKKDFWDSIDYNVSNYFKFLKNINNKFPRIKYKDVKNKLMSKGEYFQTTHLREKRGNILTSEFNSPVFVYEFPFSLRHFYSKKCPENHEYTHTFDLIGHDGIGEIASGGEREFRSEIIEKQIREKKFRLESNHTLLWYRNFKKYGSVPHAGFSLGLERITAWLTRTDHINKTIGFPRRLVGNNIEY